jgi:small subunit ribosomal protein S6
MALREYELMYIVRPTVSEEELTAATDKVDGMVTTLGGEVVEKQPWGRRRLAYTIENHEDGYYIVARLNLDAQQTHELEEQLRISDEVIRHMLTQAVDVKNPIQPPSMQAPVAQQQAPNVQDESAVDQEDVPVDAGEDDVPETQDEEAVTEE